MKKNLLLFVMAFLATLKLGAQEIAIGTGTSYDNRVAFCPLYMSSWWESIYLSSEIGTDGYINSISLHHPAGERFLYYHVYIYMGHRSDSLYENDFDWTEESNLTLVHYDSDIRTGGYHDEWEQYELSEPFYYNGNDNLVVVFAKYAGFGYFVSNDVSYYYTFQNQNRSIYRAGSYTDAYSFYPGTNSGNRELKRPNIKLLMNSANCMYPREVQVSNVSETSCTINWLSNGNNNPFEYQLKASNENWSMASLLTTTDSSLTINMLTPNTRYNFRIRTNCGSDTSVWVYRNFMTLSIPAELPYYCNFNDENENALWTLYSTNANHWVIGTGTSYENDGIGKSLYVSNDTLDSYAADSTLQHSHLLAERLINFGDSPITCVVNLDWKASGNDTPNSVYPYSGILFFVRDANEVIPDIPDDHYIDHYYKLEHLQYSVNNNDWTHITVQLDSISGHKRLLFYTNHLNATGASIVPPAIDNISIEETDCITPTMTFTSTNTNTATITHNGPDTGDYILIYRPNNTDVSANISVTFSGSSVTIDNLTVGTDYLAWIRQICGPDTSTLSFFATPFGSPCGVITVTDFSPWIDDFSNEPRCWEQPDDYDLQWARLDQNLLVHYGYGQSYLISPVIDIESVTTPFLKFDQQRPTLWSNNEWCVLKVFYRSLVNDSDTSWHILNQYINALNTWRTDSLPLPNSLTTIQIMFQVMGNGNGQGNCFIDNVSIYHEENPPACSPPIGLTANNITGNSAELSWMLADNEPVTLYYKQGNMGTYTAIPNVTLTEGVYLLDNLSRMTIYNWYLTLDCGDSTVYYTDVMSFTTPCGSIIVTDSNAWTETFSSAPDECWDYEYYFDYLNFYNFVTWDYHYNGFLYIENGTYDVAVITPVIDISRVTRPGLKFKRMQTGEDSVVDPLTVYYRNSTGGEWIELGFYTDLADDWQTDSLILPDASANYQLKFSATGRSDYGYGCAIDDICVYNVPNPPSCIAPIALSSNNISTSSADLSWTMVSEGTVSLHYKAASDSIYTTIDDVALTNGVYTLHVLASNTTYQWYLSAICDNGESANTNVRSFISLCDLLDIPYSHDFEGITGNMPECWHRTGTFLFPPLELPVIYDYQPAHSGQSALAFGSDNNIPAYAVMPEFSSDLNTLALNFWYAGGGGSGTLSIGYMTDLTDAGTFVEVWSINGTQIQDGDYHHYEVRFDSVQLDFSNQYHIAFKFYSADLTYPFWTVDDINVTFIPQCTRPDSLASYNITSSSAELSWSGEANSYTLYYKKDRDITYTEILNVTLDEDGFYLLTNLDTGTRYEWYVAAICEDGTSTESIIRDNFITLCVPLSSVPASWDFEGNLDSEIYNYPMPLCWERTISTYYPYVAENSINAYSGTHSLCFNNFTRNSYAILPEIDTNELDINELQLSFYAKASHYDFSSALEVGVMTRADNPNTFTLIGTINPTTNYELYEIPLSSHTGSDCHVAFKNTAVGYPYNNFFVDDVTLEYVSYCTRPLALTATPDSNSVALSWLSTASYFTLYYKKTSDSLWQIVPNVNLNSNGEYVLTGLVAGTPYEWYVETACDIVEEMASTIQRFHTIHSPVALPYQTNFATPGEWILNNGTLANYWTTGIPVGDTEPALFVTYDGNFAGYNTGSRSTIVAEKMFLLPANDNSIHVEFDMLVGGELFSDYLKIFLAPDTMLFYNNTGGNIIQFDASYSAYTFDFTSYKDLTGMPSYAYMINLTQENTIHVSMDIPRPYACDKAKLAFLWTNDNSGGTQPAAIIRNLLVCGSSDTTCVSNTPTVNTLPVSGLTQTSVTLNGDIINPNDIAITDKGFLWKPNAGNLPYTLVYITGNELTHQLTGLWANTSYTYRAFATTSNTTLYGEKITFTTLEGGVEPCHTPTNLAVSNITQTTASVTWNAGGSETLWRVEHRLQNDNNWQGTDIQNTSYNLTSLAAESVYDVRVKALCDDTESDFISTSFNTLPVGIDNISLSHSIILTPNPANKHIDLRINSKVNVREAVVYNIFGQIIQKIELTDNHARIDLSGMASGIYFVRVDGDNTTATKKFIQK